jgi:hypothetical protein
MLDHHRLVSPRGPHDVPSIAAPALARAKWAGHAGCAYIMMQFVGSDPRHAGRSKMATRPMALLERPFYFILSLVIAAVVAAGFSRTIEKGLIHPPIPVPHILYFPCAKLLLFFFQSC